MKMNSTNESTSGVLSSAAPSTGSIQRPALIRVQNTDLSSSGVTPAGSSAESPEGNGAARIMHSLRRRWLVASVVAVPLAAIAMFTVWSMQSTKYVATATMRLKPNPNVLMFKTQDGDQNGNFDSFKKTQKQMLQMPLVLSAALRNEEIASLEVVRVQKDPLEWLTTELIITFPDLSEIMSVSLTGGLDDELDKVVNAVVDAYFDEVVYHDRVKKLKRYETLTEKLTKHQQQLSNARKKLRALTDHAGSGDKQSLSIIQKSMLDGVDVFQKKLYEHKIKLLEMQEEFTLLSNMKSNDDQIQLSEAEIDAFLGADVEWVTLANDRKVLQSRMDKHKKLMGPQKGGEGLQAWTEQLAEVTRKMDARKDKVIEDALARSHGVDSLEKLARDIELMKNLSATLNKELERAQAEAKSNGMTSLEVELVRDEIASLKLLVDQLSNEVKVSEIELPKESDAEAGRVQRLSKAIRPRPVKSNAALVATAASGSIGFLLPFLLFVLVDVRHDRISTNTEVTRGLGLSVIGSVPILPRRVMRNLGGQSEGDKYWRTLLSESVDSIAAVLLRGAQPGMARVIMVSSANAGEGKTTLAAHLAVSLAGANRRTLLVDFDLRRPALHRVFNVSLDPGVNEILRDDVDMDATVQATQVANLMILSAGRWSRTGLSNLGNANLGGLFERLRTGYDFVIVDASPILPVVDTRVIGQYVDAVLLSVLRDVTRAPRLRSACELMDLFGIPVLGAVVTGSSQEAYTYYEPMKETKVV